MVKGKVYFDTERCKACELCVYFCPTDVLGIDMNILNELGYHPAGAVAPEKCTGCGVCALMCPDLVITVERE